MPYPDRAVRYVDVVRLPGIAAALTATSLCRLSYAAVSLALLVTVNEGTGSFAVAGAAVAAYAVASAIMPVKSRMIDRVGRRLVLPPLGALTSASLCGIAASARAGVGAPAVFIALAGVAGLAAPPVGPSMRALWAELTPDLAMRQRAYSLDAVSEEVLFAVGPLMVGALLTIWGGWVALLVTAGLNLIGACGLALTPGTGTRVAAPGGRAPVLGPLRSGPFIVLVLLLAGIGLGGGPLEVAVVARAQQHGNTAAAGWLLTGLSVGSAIGGTLWGRYARRYRPGSHLAILAAALTAWTAAAALTPDLATLGIVLFLLGTVTSPTLIVAFLASDELIADGLRTEATTWVATAHNAGTSLGAAAAGVLVQRYGPAIALVVGATVYAITSASAAAGRQRLNTRLPRRAT